MGALVSEMTDTTTVVTLVNTDASSPRTVVVQGGAYGEHRIESVESGGKISTVNASSVTVRLAAGAGATLTIGMKRYTEQPTELFPWSAGRAAASPARR